MHLETQHARGEIGYIVHPDCAPTGIGKACVALLSEWAFDDLGLERIEIRADVRNVASRRTAMAAGYRFEGVLRRAMSVGDERVDDVLFSLVPGDPRPWHTGATAAARAGLGWPRLTDGRLVVRPFDPDDAPAVQAACDDPDIGQLDLRATRSLQARGRRGVHRRRAPPLLLGERARLAVTDAAHRRAPRQRQPGPLRRAPGGRDRLLGQAGGAPQGRSPGGGAPRRRLGLRRARRRAPRAAHLPWQRGLAGPRGQAGIHARVPAARLSRARGGQEPRGAGRAVPGRRPPAPRRPGAVRAPALRPAAARLKTKERRRTLRNRRLFRASHPNASLSIQRTFSMRSLSGLSPDSSSVIRRTVSLRSLPGLSPGRSSPIRRTVSLRRDGILPVLRREAIVK